MTLISGPVIIYRRWGATENFGRIQRGDHSNLFEKWRRGGGGIPKVLKSYQGGSLRWSNIQRGDRLNFTSFSPKSSPPHEEEKEGATFFIKIGEVEKIEKGEGLDGWSPLLKTAAAHFSLLDTVNTLTLLTNNVELSILMHFLLVCPGACCHCSFHSILVSWL